MLKPQADSGSSVRYEEVDAESQGQRVDNFLLGMLKGVPRSHVYRLIRSGQVRVNSGRIRASYRLKEGDRVRVPPVATYASSPAQIPMERISLHPDCGFSPSVQNPMDLDEAGAKLGAMCEAAKLLREKYGAGSSL